MEFHLAEDTWIDKETAAGRTPTGAVGEYRETIMKRTISGLFAAAAALAVAGPLSAQTKWDMPVPYGDKTFHTVNVRAFADDVKAATGGGLVITVHSAGSLIKHPEIKNSVRRGLVPIGESLMSRHANEDAVFAVDSVPFLAANYDEAMKLWSASRPIIDKKLDAQGLKLLYAVPWPPQGVYAKKLLNSTADMKGLKFRAYNSSTERLAQLAGAIPTQIEAPDIPTAFATGRVESMITSPSTGANSKAWDFLSHFHHTQAWLPKNMIIVNKKAFAKLGADVQKAVLDAAAKAEQRGWEMSMSETDAKIAVMKKNGITIVTPSAALKSDLSAIGKTMTGEWVAKAGADGKAVLSAYGK